MNNLLSNNENISISDIQNVINKYKKTGFDGLDPEDLAISLVSIDFQEMFKLQLGIDWKQKYELKCVQQLTKSNFDMQWIFRRPNEIFNPLFISASKGEMQNVMNFIKKQKDEQYLTAVDSTKKTALHLACKEGQVTMVEYLLSKRFSPNSRERSLKTPLHLACINGHETIADLLIKCGSQLTAKDQSGANAFHFACTSNSSRLIALFIASNPEMINYIDNSNRTGLHYSIWNQSLKQVDIIRTLLDHKAKINVKDQEGKTPLHHAAEGQYIIMLN